MPVKILDNITSIECVTILAGSHAATLLADLGARMINADGNWIKAWTSWLRIKTR